MSRPRVQREPVDGRPVGTVQAGVEQTFPGPAGTGSPHRLVPNGPLRWYAEVDLFGLRLHSVPATGASGAEAVGSINRWLNANLDYLTQIRTQVAALGALDSVELFVGHESEPVLRERRGDD